MFSNDIPSPDRGSRAVGLVAGLVLLAASAACPPASERPDGGGDDLAPGTDHRQLPDRRGVDRVVDPPDVPRVEDLTLPPDVPLAEDLTLPPDGSSAVDRARADHPPADLHFVDGAVDAALTPDLVSEDLTCSEDQLRCEGVCASCPSGPAVNATGCEGTSCVSTHCSMVVEGQFYLLCAGDCRPCPSENVSNLACGGALCLATFCHAENRLLPGGAGCRPWIFETVDDGSDLVGIANDMVVDRSGTLHLLYWDTTDDQLKHAHQTGTGGWSREVVDATAGAGLWISAAVDAQDRLHVSYRNYQTDELRYAVSDGATWSLETLATGIGVGRNADLALDSSGTPHVAFLDGSEVRLLWPDGAGGWSQETSATGALSADLSLVMDALDRPHIFYLRSDERLVRASRVGTWQSEVLEPDARVRSFAAAAAADGAIFFTTVTEPTPEIRVLYLQQLGEAATVVYGGAFFGQPTLAVSGDHTVHIGIVASAERALHHVRWRAGSLSTHRVNPETVPAQLELSLALDTDNLPLFSFYHADDNHLVLAR